MLLARRLRWVTTLLTVFACESAPGPAQSPASSSSPSSALEGIWLGEEAKGEPGEPPSTRWPICFKFTRGEGEDGAWVMSRWTKGAWVPTGVTAREKGDELVMTMADGESVSARIVDGEVVGVDGKRAKRAASMAACQPPAVKTSAPTATAVPEAVPDGG